MELAEFSNQFDTQIASYNLRQMHGEQDNLAFDEYEKSVFLTKAQEELVLAYYTGKNSDGEGFEYTEEIRRYLANLIKEASLSPITTSNGMPLGISSSSKFFTLPEDLWFITYEAATVSSSDCHNGSTLDVIPITQDEYHKIKRNPFRGANGRRVLRLDLAEKIVELVSKYDISSYYLRYLSELTPIILVSLPDGMTIHGQSDKSPCVLHPALHQHILDLAVSLAISSKSIWNKGSEKQ